MKNASRVWLFVALPLLLLTGPADGAFAQESQQHKQPEGDVQLELVSVRKISAAAPHSAFTDLFWHDSSPHDGFYCVFREGAGHVSPEATIRVLFSPDGQEWETAATLAAAGFDLRDAKISITPSGKLAILCGAAVREGKQAATSHYNFLYTSEDGRTWTEPQDVARENTWLWRLTWHGDEAYGIGYEVAPAKRAAKEYGTSLWHGKEGDKLEVLVESLFTEHGPTEATLRFADDDTLYCLQRRDGRPQNTAVLGTSKPPYREWTWQDLGVYFGGPDFLSVTVAAPQAEHARDSQEAPSTQAWIAGGRLISPEQGARTVLCQLDVEAGKLLPLLELPSGGDTSYPGLVWRKNRLYVSYYSSHEGKTSIYFAEIKVTAK